MKHTTEPQQIKYNIHNNVQIEEIANNYRMLLAMCVSCPYYRAPLHNLIVVRFFNNRFVSFVRIFAVSIAIYDRREHLGYLDSKLCSTIWECITTGTLSIVFEFFISRFSTFHMTQSSQFGDRPSCMNNMFNLIDAIVFVVLKILNFSTRM